MSAKDKLDWTLDIDAGEYECGIAHVIVNGQCEQPRGRIYPHMPHAYNRGGIVLCTECVGRVLAPLALNAGVAPNDESAPDDELTLRDWLEAQPTREVWLMEKVLGDLAPIFEAEGLTLPPVRVSCGWTGAGMEGCTLGICFHTDASDAHVNEIFVTPAIDDATQVLSVLMHELAHAVAGVQHQHDERYVEVCEAVGLTVGLPNQAQPGPALQSRLAKIARASDAYPHAKVTPPPPSGGGGGGGKSEAPPKDAPKDTKTQSTRLLKAECGECGYVIRLTMKWASRGLPVCPVCTPSVSDRVLKLADGGGA